MRGLIKKDVLLMRKSFGWIYLFPVIVILLGTSGNPQFLMILLSVGAYYVGNALAIGTLGTDSKYNWDDAVKSLPVTSTEVILSKYILQYIPMLIITPALLIVVIVLNVFFGLSTGMLLLSLLAGLCLTLVYNAVVFPIVFKFGVDKLQIASVCYIGVIVVAGFVVGKLFPNMNMIPSELQVYSLLIAIVLFCLVLQVLSFLISDKLIRARSWS